MFSNEDQREFLRQAYELALQSPDPSTQNAAIILDRYGDRCATGVNTFPTGVQSTSDRLERPTKYLYVEHAERNAIFNAAYYGECTAGRVMVCPWAACADCARAIIGAGISTLITHKQSFDNSSEHWKESISHAHTMLNEAGVGIIWYSGRSVFRGKSVLRDGENWYP